MWKGSIGHFTCLFCKKEFQKEILFLQHLLRNHKCSKSEYKKLFPNSDLALIPDKRINRKKSKEELTKCSRLGSKHSKETKEKMSVARKGMMAWNKGLKNTVIHTEEYKQKMREQQCRLLAERKGKSTSIEIKIRYLLETLEIEYYEQFILQNYVVDFYIPKANLVIECFGDYWHNRSDIKEKDKRKLFNLKKEFLVLVLWESEINTKIDSCYNKILGAL